MTAYFRLSEAQERDLSLVSASLNVMSEMFDNAQNWQITLNPEEVAALITILQERLPDTKAMPFVVE
jgi:hypothetical protein